MTLVPLLVLLTACSGDDPKDAADDTSGGTDSADSGGETGETAETAETGDTGEPFDPVAYCAGLGLPNLPWQEAEESTALGAVAADFTLETTTGDWSFRENFSGCDSYLFTLDTPAQSTSFDGTLWDSQRDMNDLFEALPKNTHLFFISMERNDDDRAAALAAVEEKVEKAIDGFSDEDIAWWRWHVHYATKLHSRLGNWLGDTLEDPNWGTGIDRSQRIRWIGSYADPTRYDGSVGWFDNNIVMVANEALYYNFEASREERLADEGATVVHAFGGELLSDPSWAGVTGEAWLDLPDAATMATFDSAEWDHSLICQGTTEFGDCPAWDYLNWAWLCDADDETHCPTEIGRWITTYWRNGRWVHDASGILPLLKDGGRRRILYYTQQPYYVYLDLRLFHSGRGGTPDEYVYLWSGGDFYGETYNARDPLTIAIPADATKVELYSVISGHGAVSPNNCAEFCKTDHHFYVNGVENVREFDEPGDSFGCMDVTGTEGTVPNQYGTWWYGRNGWCPGKEVPMVAIDITDQVVPGADNVFDYEGYQGGANYPSGGATLLLSSWLVISK